MVPSPRQRLVLGQVKVAEKSNEVVAIPRLPDILAIEGAIVTIDAMGCQRKIAGKIIDKKADYVLALKGNRTSLHDDVELFVKEQKARGFQDAGIDRHTSVDDGHGRIETRTTTVIDEIAWLQDGHGWPGLKSIVMVESIRETGEKTERETRLSISSLAIGAEKPGPIVRSRWAVENSLHWVMDMVFRDDECRLRTDHAPANFTTIEHMAHNLIRKVAAWDDDFLVSLISQ